MTAYDYANQRWVEGEEAKALRIGQLKQDLELLESPKGQDFLNFTGSKTSLAEAIASCRARIGELTND